MKNKELFDFAAGLNAVTDEFKGRVFAHAVVLNRKKIDPFVKSLQEAAKPSKEMDEYFTKFEELKKVHCNKDEEGNPVVKMVFEQTIGREVPHYDINGANDPKSPFSIEREKLISQYKDVIEQHREKMTDWNDNLMEKDSDFEPYMIEIGDLPEDIGPNQLQSLIYMIND